MHRAIIQAGGKGARLQPYTTILPKPLMPIGDCAVLEIVIRQLVHNGFSRITITVGHLGHLIIAVVGDGSQWGANVDYFWEHEPRGTMGALGELELPAEPVLVMNGDLLTSLNYSEFFESHTRADVKLSIAGYHKPMSISLGVLEVGADQSVTGFREKPTLTFPCSMGIYVLEPALIAQIPSRGIFGFDDLMRLVLSEEIPARVFPFEGLWLDIGRPEDYGIAAETFEQHRDQLLPPVPHGSQHTPAANHRVTAKRVMAGMR